MDTTTEPHSFDPIRFWDRWIFRGRCKVCHAPKGWHPATAWFSARALGDSRYPRQSVNGRWYVEK